MKTQPSFFKKPATQTAAPTAAPASTTEDKWKEMKGDQIPDAQSRAYRFMAGAYIEAENNTVVTLPQVQFAEDTPIIPMLAQFTMPMPSLEDWGFRVLKMQLLNAPKTYTYRNDKTSRTEEKEWKFPWGWSRPSHYVRLVVADPRGVITHLYASVTINLSVQGVHAPGGEKLEDGTWGPRIWGRTGYQLFVSLNPDTRDYDEPVITDEFTNVISTWLYWKVKGIFNPILQPSPVSGELKNELSVLAKRYTELVGRPFVQYNAFRRTQTNLCPCADQRLYHIVAANSLTHEEWMGDEKLFSDLDSWHKKLVTYVKANKLDKNIIG